MSHDEANDARAGPETAGSVDRAEIAKFEAMAAAWWDPAGKFRPLHRLNPVRIGFIRDRACQHFGRDPKAPRPLEGLTLLDIGCGGGLIAEPMARLGARVVGLDAAERNIQIARAHAAESGLAIDYRHETAEALRDRGQQFDIVLNLEVVEHVADVDGFVGATVDLTRPDGLMVVATLNRTAKSFALAIVGAEYLLRWLPRGTHDWRRFLKPSELDRHLRHHGAGIAELVGVSYDPLNDRWATSRDLAVNYLALVTRVPASDRRAA